MLPSLAPPFQKCFTDAPDESRPALTFVLDEHFYYNFAYFYVKNSRKKRIRRAVTTYLGGRRVSIPILHSRGYIFVNLSFP